jgi:hypothetical protein
MEPPRAFATLRSSFPPVCGNIATARRLQFIALGTAETISPDQESIRTR